MDNTGAGSFSFEEKEETDTTTSHQEIVIPDVVDDEQVIEKEQEASTHQEQDLAFKIPFNPDVAKQILDASFDQFSYSCFEKAIAEADKEESDMRKSLDEQMTNLTTMSTTDPSENHEEGVNEKRELIYQLQVLADQLGKGTTKRFSLDDDIMVLKMEYHRMKIEWYKSKIVQRSEMMKKTMDEIRKIFPPPPESN